MPAVGQDKVAMQDYLGKLYRRMATGSRGAAVFAHRNSCFFSSVNGVGKPWTIYQEQL